MTMQHPLSAKVGTNFAKGGGRSVGIGHLRTEVTKIFYSLYMFFVYGVECSACLSAV
jgi:hypothetical protein